MAGYHVLWFNGAWGRCLAPYGGELPRPVVQQHVGAVFEPLNGASHVAALLPVVPTHVPTESGDRDVLLNYAT